MSQDLESLISGLPTWLQTVIVLAVIVAGAFIGKKTAGQNKSTTNKPKPTKSSKSRSSTLQLEAPSPGQTGQSATKDLTRDEISQLHISYAPQLDNDPDPGEVVWTWVPFVENNGQGKDRPVLIIARIDKSTVAGCYLSTKEHRGFLSVGTGAWDAQGRPSYLSPERVLRVTHNGMRREGATMPKQNFESVAKRLKQIYGIE